MGGADNERIPPHVDQAPIVGLEGEDHDVPFQEPQEPQVPKIFPIPQGHQVP